MIKQNSFIIYIIHSVFYMLFASCVTLKPVEVKSVENFKLKDIITKPGVQFDVMIHNPNSFGLTLKEFKSNAFLGEKIVTDIFVKKKIRIGANSDISIPLESQPSLSDISSMILSGNVSGDLKVEGYITVKKFIFRKKFPFRVQTKI